MVIMMVAIMTLMSASLKAQWAVFLIKHLWAYNNVLSQAGVKNKLCSLSNNMHICLSVSVLFSVFVYMSHLFKCKMNMS